MTCRTITSARRRSRRRHLVRQLSKLSPLERRVFLLTARDGFSYGQVAECLNMSVNVVELVLARALATLDRAQALR